jgi:hypothetical protein
MPQTSRHTFSAYLAGIAEVDRFAACQEARQLGRAQQYRDELERLVLALGQRDGAVVFLRDPSRCHRLRRDHEGHGAALPQAAFERVHE